MIRLVLISFFTLAVSAASAQRWHVGVFGGLSAYNGDLVEGIFPRKVVNGVIGLSVNYEVTDNIMIRGGYNFTRVGGADRFNSHPVRVARNLSFETKINEFSLIGEYYLQNLYDNRFSPYGFLGLAVYKFDPYAFNGNDRVFLQPLTTEGQGITGYSENPYKLTQFAVPLGLGAKYAVTDRLRAGLEVGYRKLFTDYLDDVSGQYADENDLLINRGVVSAEMAFRGDDIDNTATSPAKGSNRGNPANKDAYYFVGIHLTYGIGSGNGGGLFNGGGRKNNMGCPVNVY